MFAERKKLQSRKYNFTWRYGKRYEVGKKNHVLGMAVLWGYEKDKNLLISHADLYIEHPVCLDFFKQIDRFNKMRIEFSGMLKS